jgi:histidine kinase
VVLSDENLLRRILQNFLSNAIRDTPRGRVLIGCRRRGGWLRIEVHDQGPGIPETLQHEIFEEFRRLDDGVANDRGAGLGLAIVERIGRLLGHRIGLHSTLGSGSVFSVTLPLGERAAIAKQLPPPTTTAENANDPILHGCRVWCVDDEPRVCEATRVLLERWECRVDFAGAPDAALAAANAEEVPELLLLDVRMGEHYGPMLLPQLVQRWQREPRVILVTAEPDPALREHALDLGWGFLSKPVRPPALRALVTQMLMRRG